VVSEVTREIAIWKNVTSQSRPIGTVKRGAAGRRLAATRHARWCPQLQPNTYAESMFSGRSFSGGLAGSIFTYRLS